MAVIIKVLMEDALEREGKEKKYPKKVKNKRRSGKWQGEACCQLQQLDGVGWAGTTILVCAQLKGVSTRSFLSCSVLDSILQPN